MGKEYYIRIGDLPPDGKSKIYRWKDPEHTKREPIGEEKGVSAYHAILDGDVWSIIPPSTISKSFVDTYTTLIKLVKGGWKPVYLVTGDKIGTGYDGEPLLKNVKIIKDISYIWREKKEE